MLWVALHLPGLSAESLPALAAWASQFTPKVALEPPEALLLEVAGSVRYFGGLASLESLLGHGLRELALNASMANAPTARAALWRARGNGLPLEELPIVERARLEREVRHVVQMLHSHGIVHGALHARNIIIDDRGGVHELDRSNGRSVWKQDKLANRQLSLPQAVGEVIAVGDLEGYVHFVARDTGAFVARYATRGGPVRAAPLPLPGGVLVQTQDGALHALAL